MTFYKICTPIDYSSAEWRDYCDWRKRSFVEFASLDSNLRTSLFSVEDDEDWRYVYTHGSSLTDLLTDKSFALHCSLRYGAAEVLSFAFLEEENSAQCILGYDILDGDLSYSLLTNFGNDIQVVNDNLAENGLITNKRIAVDVHKWFKENMAEDPHVRNSRIFTVYKPEPQQNITTPAGAN